MKQDNKTNVPSNPSCLAGCATTAFHHRRELCLDVKLQVESTELKDSQQLPVCVPQAGIVHLQWEDSSSVVSTCCLDGALRLWDARTGQMVSEYRGHTAEILDFTVNRYQLVANNLKSCRVAVEGCCLQPSYKTNALFEHPRFLDSKKLIQCPQLISVFGTSQGLCVQF